MAATLSSVTARQPSPTHALNGDTISSHQALESVTASASMSCSPFAPMPLLLSQQEPQEKEVAPQEDFARDDDTSSLSSLSDLSSEEEEDGEAESLCDLDGLRRASSTPSQASSPRTTARSRKQSSRGKKRYVWSHAEDKVLIDSVERWGLQLNKVQQALRKAGHHHREIGAIRNRYGVLVGNAARHRKIAARSAASSSTSTSNPQPQLSLTSAALLAALSALHTRRTRDRQQRWTKREVDKLTALARIPSSLADVYLQFCRAFPRTTRTQQSVMIRCSRIRNGRAAGGGEPHDRSRDEEEVEDEEEEEDEENDDDEDGDDQELMHHGCAKRSCTAPCRAVAGPPVTHTPAAAASTSGVKTARRQGRKPNLRGVSAVADATATNGVPSSPHPPALDVNITCEHNGFRITSLPPGYGVRILTPTQCQLIGPEQLRTYIATPTPPSYEVPARDSAPFVFKAEQDGSIQALVLPPRTSMSISLVNGCEGRGLLGGRQDSLMVETRFVSSDGYTLVFASPVQ